MWVKGIQVGFDFAYTLTQMMQWQLLLPWGSTQMITQFHPNSCTYQISSLPPTNMELEYGLLEDCFPLQTGGYPRNHDCFREGTCTVGFYPSSCQFVGFVEGPSQLRH